MASDMALLDSFVERAEAAVWDRDELEQLADEIEAAAGLDDLERAIILGRVEQYRQEMAIWEAGPDGTPGLDEDDPTADWPDLDAEEELEAEEWLEESRWNVKHVFDPALHPRDRAGKFRDVLGKLGQGEAVKAGRVMVYRNHSGGFRVRIPNKEIANKTYQSADEAAKAATNLWETVPVPKGSRAKQAKPPPAPEPKPVPKPKQLSKEKPPKPGEQKEPEQPEELSPYEQKLRQAQGIANEGVSTVEGAKQLGGLIRELATLDPEYVKEVEYEQNLEAAMREARAEMNKAADADKEYYREHYMRYARLLRNNRATKVTKQVWKVLGQVRPMGGELKVEDYTDKGNGQKAVERAQQYMPEDWIDKSNNWGYATIQEAEYGGVHRTGGTGVSNIEVQLRSTPIVVHEFMHRMEMIMPGLNTLCRQFRHQRAPGEKPAKLPGYAKSDSNGVELLGVKNKFTDKYAGRVYRSGDTEILSVGMQQLVGGTNLMKRDPDYADFILGLLGGFYAEGAVGEAR